MQRWISVTTACYMLFPIHSTTANSLTNQISDVVNITMRIFFHFMFRHCKESWVCFSIHRKDKYYHLKNKRWQSEFASLCTNVLWKSWVCIILSAMLVHVILSAYDADSISFDETSFKCELNEVNSANDTSTYPMWSGRDNCRHVPIEVARGNIPQRKVASHSREHSLLVTAIRFSPEQQRPPLDT